MANTYVLIASSTAGSGGAANIDFTSIPATYTDLLLKVSARGTDTGSFINTAIKFNNTASNQTLKRLYGNGSSIVSDSQTSLLAGVITTTNATANTFSNQEYYIPNYAGSANKSLSYDSVSENNATESYNTLAAGLWSDSTAINRITVTPTLGDFVQYSTAYLYGIKNS